MCGIAGKWLAGGRSVATSDLERMGTAIAHRGPDDAGSYRAPDCSLGLAFRRLAIVDLSERGHQPMRYRDRFTIVFNGEIYNYREERTRLERLGHRFVSDTDTEVILALYAEHGPACLRYLRGMFAFAIYDERERILFCARDRVGKKPFKYYYERGVFLFASELKAILTQSEVAREPDEAAIHDYLTYQYVPAPQTGFVGIKKLKPGHSLTLDCRRGTIHIDRYWQLDYTKKLRLPELEWQERILRTLDEAVKIRMEADVPLGAFLSGGIDSSAVVGLMSRHAARPVKTFSIGFAEAKFNELAYARQIAERFATDHTEFVVRPEAIETLPLLVRHYEEPYADSSALPTYYVSKLTREHVTVALNGDGGDENFAGYSRYSVQQFSLLYDRFRLLNSSLAVPAARLLYRRMQTTFAERAQRFAETMAKDYARRYANYVCYFTNEAKDELYTHAFKERLQAANSEDLMADLFVESGAPDRMDQMLYADIAGYLPDDLLAKVDIASMAVSLEGRSPFLDHTLLELTAQIPFDLKLRPWDKKKYILKQALRGLVPDEILFRPKMGFGIPVEAWFRGDLAGYVESVLLSPRATARGLFNEAAVRRLLRAHRETKVNFGHRIWALLTLELWFREYLD